MTILTYGIQSNVDYRHDPIVRSVHKEEVNSAQMIVFSDSKMSIFISCTVGTIELIVFRCLCGVYTRQS